MLVKSLGRGELRLELCKCGHLACDHGSQLTPLPEGRSYREYNQGSCCECGCKRFTFERFVTLKEAAELKKPVHH